MTYISSDLLLIQRQGERERNREIQRYRGREKGRETERKKGTVKMKNEIERETHTKRDRNKKERSGRYSSEECLQLNMGIAG